MRRTSLRQMTAGPGRRLAACVGIAGAIATVMALGAATAQAWVHEDSSSPDSGDSTGFVHKVQWSSSSPAPGVTLLSGVY